MSRAYTPLQTQGQNSTTGKATDRTGSLQLLRIITSTPSREQHGSRPQPRSGSAAPVLGRADCHASNAAPEASCMWLQ
jgi:hypothetical protein